MIDLPEELTPSELLCCEGVTPFIDKLLEGSRSLCAQGDWLEAERCVLEAVEISQEADARINRGAALVYLGDVCREMRKLGPALAHYREAHRIFQHQPSLRQRHNEAVAAYALGLMHQLLGGDTEALKWYQESSELLEKAKENWVTVNALDHVDGCTRVQRWMEALTEYLTAALTRKDVRFSTRIWIPIILWEKAGSVVEQLRIDRLDRELIATFKSFRLHPLREEWDISLRHAAQYDAQEIPDEIRSGLNAGERDHALVEWGERPNQVDPAETERLVQSEIGDFVRDDDGRVHVLRSGPVRPIVIGDRDWGDETRAGYIPALLRPVCAPSVPSVPRASGRRNDSVELYRELVSRVGGDRQVARSLVEYERNQEPNAGLSELIDRAIVRLARDRR